MKGIELEQFKTFTFLSALEIAKDKSKVFFVRTKVDEDNDGYLQQMVSLDASSHKVKEETPWEKRMVYFVLDDGLFIVKNDQEKKGTFTTFHKLTENGLEEAFTLPVSVGRIVDFGQHYVVSANIKRTCPDYYCLSQEEKDKVDQEIEDNEDYIVFDEYPFVFNGAGIVNGNRNALFLVDKKDYSIKRITPETFDVGSFNIINGELIFNANDFTTFKTKYDKVYKYDLDNGRVEKIYDEKMQIHQVFEEKGKIFVKGTFGKDFGDMEAGKIYELVDGKMELRIDTQYSLFNTVTTDSRYGRSKNRLYENDTNYFLTCAQEKSILIKMVDDHFETVLAIDGTVDDFVVGKDCIYIIGMYKQNLQEIYQFKDNKLIQLTQFNKQALEDCYVATPEKLTVKKAVAVDGWVLKPKDYDPNKKYPASLDSHGGPKGAYGTIYYHEMQHWASLGYFVMYCNPRGSDGKGNFFADLRHQFGGIDYQDIMAFVNLVLETYPAIDKERMGVTGGSYGGYMTNWIIGQTNMFKCAATQRSISNWITEVGVSDYGIDFPIEQEFADTYNCADELWSMSPLKFANNVETPTLFIHSIEDYRCPVPEALQLYTALTCRGVKTRMVLFKGENHELSRSGKPSHRVRRLTEITEWMNQHLK